MEHAFFRRRWGRHEAKAGSKSTAVADTAPVAKITKSTQIKYFMKKYKTVSSTEPKSTKCSPEDSSTATISSLFWPGCAVDGDRKSSTPYHAPRATRPTASRPTHTSLTTSPKTFSCLFQQDAVSLAPLSSSAMILSSEDLEMPTAGKRGGRPDSAKPMVTAEARMATISSLAPAFCACIAFWAKVHFPCCTNMAQRRHLGSRVQPKGSTGRTTTRPSTATGSAHAA
mmetsp:Transcript_104584/g.248967  ORF Transcript_104584/g.248967 Transcript_104584/m.248967 type:complete len:227 (+) Transcript_104584:495-1175(+)